MAPYLVFLLVLVSVAMHAGDASASHSSGTQPCSVQIRGQMLPVYYMDAPRNNPDDTYYPGDAFYYIIWYSAGPACVGFHEDRLTHDGLELHDSSGDGYVDKESRRWFEEAARDRCDNVRQYSGCVSGLAAIKGNVTECTRADPDRCINQDAKMVKKVTAIKRVCSEITGCRDVPITRSVTLVPDILVPDLNIILNTELVSDPDGYDARNLDETYYMWDPIVIRQVPDLLWKNHRSNTLHFEVVRIPDSRLEMLVDCVDNQCTKTLEHPAVKPSTWDLGNGDDITMYNATGDSSLGRNFFAYDVVATNAGLVIDHDHEKIDVLVVQYDPEYSQYPYSALSDDHKTSYENRAAVALHYFGSFGGGPDDTESLHEDRRSKINDFHYFGVGFDPWNPVSFDEILYWDEARDAGVLEEHDKVSIMRYPDVEPSSNVNVPCEIKTNDTAVLVRAGYCTVYFDYPILDTVYDVVAGPRYENATLFNTLMSDRFAGRDTYFLSHYEYRFPEPLFNTNLHIKLVQEEDMAGMILGADILTKDGFQTIKDYLDEKIVHDSADPGFGIMISNDTYPIQYSESGLGSLDVKLRRIASFFESYDNTSEQNVAGLDIVDLAPAYLGNSHDARLEIPLDVGLGALSPMSLNVTAGNTTRNYTYDYVDFGVEKEIPINVAHDNLLEVVPSPGSVSITVPEDFGEITRLHVNNIVLDDVSCSTRCTISLPDDQQSIIVAENYWGGQAHGISPEVPVQRTPPASPNIPVLILFVLSLPILYWVYHRIRNRT